MNSRISAIAQIFVCTTMRKTIRDVMSWKHPILYFTVMATISAVLTPCFGQIPDASISMPKNAKMYPTTVRSGRLVVGNNVQRRRVGFEVTNDESAASDRIKTQNGSLAFEAGNRAGQPASQGKPPGLPFFSPFVCKSCSLIVKCYIASTHRWSVFASTAEL